MYVIHACRTRTLKAARCSWMCVHTQVCGLWWCVARSARARDRCDVYAAHIFSAQTHWRCTSIYAGAIRTHDELICVHVLVHLYYCYTYMHTTYTHSLLQSIRKHSWTCRTLAGRRRTERCCGGRVVCVCMRTQTAHADIEGQGAAHLLARAVRRCTRLWCRVVALVRVVCVCIVWFGMDWSLPRVAFNAIWVGVMSYGQSNFGQERRDVMLALRMPWKKPYILEVPRAVHWVPT